MIDPLARYPDMPISFEPPAISRRVVAGLFPATVRLQARSVQGGANPLQVNLLRPVANRNCVRRGGEQREVNRVVRSESKLDSATLTGEPAVEG